LIVRAQALVIDGSVLTKWSSYLKDPFSYLSANFPAEHRSAQTACPAYVWISLHCIRLLPYGTEGLWCTRPRYGQHNNGYLYGYHTKRCNPLDRCSRGNICESSESYQDGRRVVPLPCENAFPYFQAGCSEAFTRYLCHFSIYPYSYVHWW
jgi:hypothetical protein